MRQEKINKNKTLGALKATIQDLRKQFPFESGNFEPWVDNILNLPENLDNNQVYVEWKITRFSNDGIPVYALSNFAIIKF